MLRSFWWEEREKSLNVELRDANASSVRFVRALIPEVIVACQIFLMIKCFLGGARMSRISWITAVTAYASLIAGPVSASVVYDNTNSFANGLSVDAWNISSSFSVADSFTFASSTNVQSVEFWAWETPPGVGHSDDLTSVGWSIILATSNTNPLGGGSVLASGTAFNIGAYVTTQNGSDIYAEMFNTGGVSLAAGTEYWLILGTAVTMSGQPVYWDQSDGPSTAYDSAIGALANCDAPGTLGTCSETFQLLGTTTSGVHEPGTLILLGGGLALLGLIRHKPRLKRLVAFSRDLEPPRVRSY